jgi:hypothetical protein
MILQTIIGLYLIYLYCTRGVRRRRGAGRRGKRVAGGPYLAQIATEAPFRRRLAAGESLLCVIAAIALRPNRVPAANAAPLLERTHAKMTGYYQFPGKALLRNSGDCFRVHFSARECDEGARSGATPSGDPRLHLAKKLNLALASFSHLLTISPSTNRGTANTI